MWTPARNIRAPGVSPYLHPLRLSPCWSGCKASRQNAALCNPPGGIQAHLWPDMFRRQVRLMVFGAPAGLMGRHDAPPRRAAGSVTGLTGTGSIALFTACGLAYTGIAGTLQGKRKGG